MTGNVWEEIRDFRSLGEFERFQRWIDAQVAEQAAEKIPVARPYLNATTFSEEWFLNRSSGQTWRLVAPDFPFLGLFERV